MRRSRSCCRQFQAWSRPRRFRIFRSADRAGLSGSLSTRRPSRGRTWRLNTDRSHRRTSEGSASRFTAGVRSRLRTRRTRRSSPSSTNGWHAGGGPIAVRSVRVLRFGEQGRWITIVSVAGDVRHSALEAEPVPELYAPHAQWPSDYIHVALRGSIPPETLTRAVAAHGTRWIHNCRCIA
jgi:hypothetical protein